MLKVLIIDDDEAIKYDLKRFDKWKNYNFEIISEAEDGYEALALIDKNQYDIIFVDIKMPRIDGLQLLSILRENNNNITVVMMSGYSDFEYTKQCIKLGAYDYLLKPIEDKELCELLERAKKHIEGQKEANEKNGQSVKQSIIINRICEYIDENMNKDINLETIADHFGYSSKHLGKLFRACKEEGFVCYITRVKMEKAKKLIASGKYKNYEISDLLGYENPDYFTALFKKQFGLTPLEYRKSNAAGLSINSK